MARPDLRADGNEVPGGVAGIAAREAEQRQAQVEAAQTLFTAGTRAFSDQSYGEAMDYFKAAFEAVPPVPAVAEQRRAFFRRYQAAALNYAKVKIEEARWAEAEEILAEVIDSQETHSVPRTLIDPEVRRIHGDLRNRDDRYNQANSPRHLQNVELVHSRLILAKGYLELGDYDRAERSYHQVLAVDPYNTAARRGLEKVERYRMDYFDVAMNHTRAKMLAEVAAGWETPVPGLGPTDSEILDSTDVASAGSMAIEQKLRQIILPRVEFNAARLADVLEFLSQMSQELDQSAPDPSKRGVNILIDATGDTGSIEPANRTLSVRLANIPLGEALRYVVQQVGMKYRVDNFAVTVVSSSVDVGATLATRTYIVPPGFLSGANQGDGGAAPADPFADPAPQGGGIQVTRISAKEFLENSGVVFGEGASARFFPATSTLMVRNTAEQLDTVNNIVQSARDSGEKMVQVGVKMISVEDVYLRQAGLDFLLGASNLGSTPRMFLGGGTDGNAAVGTDPADFVFNQGGAPVGLNPLTSGLRTGSLGTTQSIEDLINRDNAGAGAQKAPGIFSLAGVFTDPQFQIVLRALNQVKGTDTLCDTRVLVKPGEVATIEQAREFIYPTEYDPPEIPNNIGGEVQVGNTIFVGQYSGIFPATPATPTAFEMRSLGKVIEVEPTVAGDNFTVNLNVVADFSDFVGFINYGTPITNPNFTLADGSPSVITDNRILMPVFDAVKETTNVNVWDGQTIVIGGYHGESVTTSADKVPFLGDLPMVGRAFRSSTTDSTKRALLIFVSVTLVDPGGNPINAPAEEPDLMTRQDEPAPAATLPATFSSPPPAYLPK